jgi:cation diffusion facilitator CzcD-associated flavoprotein CzcO
MRVSYDAIIIGAGISGLYQLHRLRELGMKVRVFETGTGVGGTWYWNRYPGARFDSESYSYGFSFSQELLDEWHWTEHFSPQPQTLKYLNFVADKFDLRRDIQFRSRVTAAHWQEESRSWAVTLEDGSRRTCRFLITAIGPLSAPTMPKIDGIESFKGQSCHTARWPHEPVSFEGKRVAVIGTGATGVQTIQEVAKTAGTLTVFQRTPNWCAPLHNGNEKGGGSGWREGSAAPHPEGRHRGRDRCRFLDSRPIACRRAHHRSRRVPPQPSRATRGIGITPCRSGDLSLA